MTKLRQQFKELLEQAGLLKKEEMSNELSRMTSSERASRHGELKQLRQLRKEQLQKEGSRKRKLLKVSGLAAGSAEMNEDEEGGNDLKDIEFRMRNTGRQVHFLVTFYYIFYWTHKSINHNNLIIY